ILGIAGRDVFAAVTAAMRRFLLLAIVADLIELARRLRITDAGGRRRLVRLTISMWEGFEHDGGVRPYCCRSRGRSPTRRRRARTGASTVIVAVGPRTVIAGRSAAK